MTRRRLPSRRRCVTDALRWPSDAGKRIHVTAGFSEDGALLEAFLRGGGRVGSDTDFLLDDMAVLLSRLLQHGDTLALIARGVGRTASGAPASLIGGVVDKLVEIEGSNPFSRGAA